MHDLTLSGDRRMTVKEVAEALGVSERTIQRHAEKMGMTRNGFTTYLSENDVTRIKQAIERSGRNDLDNVVEVRQATTSLEIEEMTLKVIAYHKSEADRLRAELAVATPKAAIADRIATADGLKTISEIGKINGIGPHKIFPLLATRKIIFRNRGVWVPYQQYVNAGYFEVKEITYRAGEEIDHLKTQTYVTGKGEIWLAKQLFAEVPS